MKKTQSRLPQPRPSRSCLWAAFFLPAVSMLAVILISNIYKAYFYEPAAYRIPFGKTTMLFSDMFHQYFPFFKAFHHAIRKGESLLYNWDVGMGLDYLGLISYYLASPLNLLSLLVPEGGLLAFFSLTLPVRLGLASLSFAYFLKKIFGRDELPTALFGCLYGMCAWALGYQWNIMWLDTFILLPLVMLGFVYLLRDRRPLLYTVTLFFSIFANYYVGFFVCIFVFLAFFCYELCRWKGFVRFLEDLARIALYSLLAIGMTAVLELPTLAALQNTQSSVNNFPEGFQLNFITKFGEEGYNQVNDLWAAAKAAKAQGDTGLAFRQSCEAIFKGFGFVMQAMKQVAGNMSGGLVPNFSAAEGLPNLYCGVGSIFMAVLFLCAKEVKLRDKLCCVFLLVFLMLSFILRQLDYIWHGFHFTNMIPYRFSFLYSFVLLYMAYRAYLVRHRFMIWHYCLALVLTIAVFLCVRERSSVFLAYNFVFLILYFAVFLYGRMDFVDPEDPSRKNQKHRKSRMERLRAAVLERKSRRTACLCFLCVTMIAELILNTVVFGTGFSFTNASNYPSGTDKSASIIRYMQEREKELFYRAEVTHAQTLNDGALNGYHGISTFTSSANVKVTEFMLNLGYGAKNTYNRYCFEEGSPVANLFLGLKYMIERDGRVEENPYFEEVHHYGSVYLLENKAYLPLGFLAQSELPDLALPGSSANRNDPFRFQNALFSAATGMEEEVWNTSPSAYDLEIDGGSGIYLNSDPDLHNYSSMSGYCTYRSSGTNTLTYRYTLKESGFLCLDAGMGSRNSFDIYKNGNYLFGESVSLSQTFAVCQVAAGDQIEVRIKCPDNTSEAYDSWLNLRFGLLRDQVFQEGFEILKASTLELTDFSGTYLKGNITCNRDGYLYTSIPQNGNWHVLVDGQEADIRLTGGVMVGVNLPEGTHTLEFVYKNEAFSLGLKISLLCGLIFGGTFLVPYLLKKSKKKKEAT